MDDRARIPEHIEAIAERSEHAARRLTTALLHRAWPGGSADRMEPAAAEWVRRWAPGRPMPQALACSCADGRCAVCN